MPSRKELDCEREITRSEHSDYLRLCRIGARLAKYLHAKPNPVLAEEALRELIETGHDLDDGSIFDCGFCWQEAKSYRRTGRLSVGE
jgi:hypothetical protein